MKRSEIIQRIAADLEEMLVNLENRPRTRPHIAKRTANNILDMLEGFGMSPPDWDDTVYGYNEGYILPPEWEPEDD